MSDTKSGEKSTSSKKQDKLKDDCIFKKEILQHTLQETGINCFVSVLSGLLFSLLIVLYNFIIHYC